MFDGRMGVRVESVKGMGSREWVCIQSGLCKKVNHRSL